MQPLERYATSIGDLFGLKPKKWKASALVPQMLWSFTRRSVTDRREGKIVKQVHLGKLSAIANENS